MSAVGINHSCGAKARIKSGKRGFSLVEVLIVVTVLGLLASVAVPTMVKARDSARSNTCISNLKKIDEAKQQWASDNKQLATATPATSDLIGPTRYLKASPLCPLDSTQTFENSYFVGNVSQNPACLKDAINHTLFE
jgi:prepilin-type N-terminal cleavage/methylation domain-containing protein